MTARDVLLEGGAPWGFRMHGGVDQNQPLRISRVNPGSKASQRGIREGDLISSINGQNTKNLTNTEAHGLLRNAGDNLKLGLNEDTSGSPKRRQYRTIHLETLQETVKRSSATSYSSSKTVERVDSQSEKANENSIDKNETSTINGTSKIIPPSNILVTKRPSSSSSSSPTLTKEDLRTTSSDNALASQRSSYTNCTLSPSSPSILSEDGIRSCTSSQVKQIVTPDNMNDNQSSSRSKKRRQRRKNLNRKITEPFIDNAETTSIKENEHVLPEEYTVQSPVELSKDKKKPTKPVKSRSLDDDEIVKIQEVSEISEVDDKNKETQAIVSEASESEVEWEETENFQTPSPIHGSLSSITLPLEGCITEEITLMSPDEEKTLRDFLEGLNLINGPEEAANQISSSETIKQRKARKKAELEQYFLPIYQNPRYLDAISEESSDRDSDRELPKTRILRKGTPENDSSNIPPKVPPRRKRITPPVEQPAAVLVDAKITDTPEKSEIYCSTFTTAEKATASNVEIVFLTSSETDSPEELDSDTSDSYVIDNKGTETEESVSNTPINTHIIKKDDPLNIDMLNQLTPPPTPDNASPNDTKGYESILRIEPQLHTNVLTPPPPSRSSSSSRSSSRESSLCTAKYNPSTSSITDVLGKEDIEEGYFQALSLREICLKSLLTLPFGKEILEELADVSKYIESYTSSLPSTVLPKLVPNLTQSVNRAQLNSNNKSYNLSVRKPKTRQEDISYTKIIPKNLMERKIPIEVDSDYQPIKVVNNIEELPTKPKEFIIPIIEEDKEVVKTQYLENEPKQLKDFKEFEKKATSFEITIKKSKKQTEELLTTSIKEKKEKEFKIPITKEDCEIVKTNDFEKKTTQKSNKQMEELLDKSIKENKIREFMLPLAKENLQKGFEEFDKKETDQQIKELPKKSMKEKNAKEFIIPIAKEDIQTDVKNSKEKATYIEKARKIVDELTTKSIKDTQTKEYIIPIITEDKHIKAENKLNVKNGSKEFKAIHENVNKPKEFIVTIRKDETLMTQEKSPNKQKEVIVPIREVDTLMTQEKNPNKQKEFIVPIRKNETLVTQEKNTDWIGMPTEGNPQLILCLSPKQKDKLETTKPIADEAGTLMDLHEKFINRMTSHKEIKQEINIPIVRDELLDLHKQFTNQKDEEEKNCKRLLTIINEESSGSTDDKNYLYFVEKDPLYYQMDTARLHAKDLNEWLNLARNKSMSESNLTTIPDYPENNFNIPPAPSRRTSLPQNIFEKQMFYIQEKEREIHRQLEALEEEKRLFNADDYYFSRKGDFAETKIRPTSMPMMPTEYFRQQMYEEYMDKFAEREERKQHKIIKVTSSKDINQESVEVARKEIVHPIQIEDEFMDKVKELQKIGKLEKIKNVDQEKEGDKNDADEPPVLVIDGEELKEAKELPKHLQEFVVSDGIWSPGQKIDLSPKELERREYEIQQDESIPPVWSPKSASSSPIVERKEFRPVNYQSPVLGRRNRTSSENLGSQNQAKEPSWRGPDYTSDTGSASLVLERKLPISRSTPASGFSDFSSTSRLPKAQNPTITLLQKAREGQLPKGASYIDQEQRQYRPKNDRPPIAGPGEILYQIKNEYTSESDNERPRKMTDLGPRKFEGIGPVNKDGTPMVLRSEVQDQNQSKWYKRMYDTIHKQKPHNDEYVTVRYKQKRAQYPYSSGYLSEPEPGAYDSDFTEYKYHTLDRRRPNTQDRSLDYNTSTMPRPTVNRSSSSDIVRNTQDYYKAPGRIENYTPGHSSIAEKEAKQWWDEVMDIFDGHLEQQNRVQSKTHPKSFINQCLKESGYESDSTLVFRRKEEAAQHLSPKEQKDAYKVIQKGGDVPLHGLRKLAPEKPKEPEPPVPPPKGQYARNSEQESPRKYVENEVTIHYKTPVRQEIKDYLSEDELAHRQAETMKKIYQEERRKKYLQELQDMNSRRHTDNFIPSQKSPISLNRYDDFDDLAPNVRPRPRSPEHRLCARALYNFVGQSARELTFRKGDLIYLRRQIDKNWYEGELNAMIGLFPANYVEIIPFEGTKTKSTLRKAHEGQARAKYNFVAQTHLELSLAKGELVVVTRKIDENWYEGKIGGRKGIFPSNYVEMLIDPLTPPPPSSKPVASPAAHSLLLNGSSGGKESMGSHSYTPSLPTPPLMTSSYHAKPVQILNYGKNPGIGQTLHIETHSEPIPYRAMYKYKPQNEDELELLEGDTVYVLEKCDDGWFVGSSDRTGAFGTFPGNYVEKI